MSAIVTVVNVELPNVIGVRVCGGQEVTGARVWCWRRARLALHETLFHSCCALPLTLGSVAIAEANINEKPPAKQSQGHHGGLGHGEGQIVHCPAVRQNGHAG
jgi:hypothetical protein